MTPETYALLAQNEALLDTGVVGLLLIIALAAIYMLYRNSTRQYEAHLKDLKEMFQQIINKLNGRG